MSVAVLSSPPTLPPGSISMLLQKVDLSNDQAINALLGRIQPNLRQIVAKLPRVRGSGNPITEITNDAMMRLVNEFRCDPKRVPFQSRQELFKWLKTVALRIRINEFRKVLTVSGQAQSRMVPHMDSNQAQSHSEAIELEIDVEEAIERLKANNPKVGRIAELRLDGYTNFEIAAQLGCSERSVEQNFATARFRLAKILAAWNEGGVQ